MLLQRLSARHCARWLAERNSDTYKEIKMETMIKRFFVLMTIVLVGGLYAKTYAQSMTDNQVIQYVLEQQQAGKNQADIVQGLLKRGVTLEQIQKIRKKSYRKIVDAVESVVLEYFHNRAFACSAHTTYDK